jgi:hypothetical protein
LEWTNIEALARDLGKSRIDYASGGLKYELEVLLDEVRFHKKKSVFIKKKGGSNRPHSAIATDRDRRARRCLASKRARTAEAWEGSRHEEQDRHRQRGCQPGA